MNEPWTTEPDRAEWRDEATGLPCLAVRHPSLGHWCGYVGVNPTHPWHGRSDNGCSLPTPCDESRETYCAHPLNIDVHGGLTYAAACHDNVCHLPAPGEEEHVWWFGFDCAHSGDLSPKMRALVGATFRVRDDVYRDLPYVRAECAKLAEQLAGVAP